MKNFEKPSHGEKNKIEPGDTIIVTNEKHKLYNREVEVIREGDKGGYWVQDENNEEFYVPFGYDKKT